MEPQVGMVLDIDCAPIASRRAGSDKRAGANTPAFQWAAVFMGILYGVIAPGDHLMSGPAERVPLSVESNIIRGIIRRLCAAIDIDKGIDIPAFQETGKARKCYARDHQWHRGSSCCHAALRR